jgi:hypothetical protein
MSTLKESLRSPRLDLLHCLGQDAAALSGRVSEIDGPVVQRHQPSASHRSGAQLGGVEPVLPVTGLALQSKPCASGRRGEGRGSAAMRPQT